ncbi:MULTISPECIES: S10 family serine carboxypeptidase-like protein [Anaerotruncus]|nr:MULTISPECIES: hypothetical protein [Anaerotruncus]
MRDFVPFYWEQEKKTSTGDTYLVRLSDFVLTDDGGEAEAAMYSYSYIGLPENKEKPVVFAYNGGPGSASEWLHMGLLGPKIMEIPGYPKVERPAKYDFTENTSFLLDCCDLVLIDPVGTGFAPLLKEEAAEKYYETQGDAVSFAKFIVNWLKINQRKDAPVYLLGESYGTIRNVVLADELPDDVNLRGIISVGTSLNVGAKGTLLVEPNVRRLGVNAAVCRYHFHPELDEADFIRDAMEFAYGDYAHALLMGNRLPADKREKVLEKLAYYSGLDRALLDKQNLRFSEQDFMTKLCPGEFVSMYDARMTLPLERNGSLANLENADIVEVDFNQEPFISCIGSSIGDCIRAYYDAELNRPEGRVYQDDTLAVAMNWDYRSYEKDTLQLPVDLMKENENLRFLFVNGRYDLSSTFDFMTYYLSQYDLPKDRISCEVLESGHASYIGDGNAKALSSAVRAFIEGDRNEL